VTAAMRRVALVGAGMLPFGEHFHMGWDEMVQRAYLAAVDSVDKGFDPQAIDAGFIGCCRPGLHGQQTQGGVSLSGVIGLPGLPATRIENGCPTGSDTARIGAMAVASRWHDVVLVVGYEKMRDATVEGLLGIALEGHPVHNRGETALAYFAPQARAHMAAYGTSPEQLAMVAVKNHANGARDPYAHHREEVTLEQVLASPMVCDPLHLLDCCPQTDGAAALLFAGEEVVDRFTDRPVWLWGAGNGTDTYWMHEKSTLTSFPATRRAAERAYAMAGVGPDDLEAVELHDCFTINEIISSEDLGLAQPGEGGKLVESGETAIGGRVPVNPSGGLLSKGHPLGATGVAQIVELFWQLRGEVAAQDPRRQVDFRRGIALQHNAGGKSISNSVVTIWGNDRPQN
jgi:acetyl-CoA C-acetyltransferase